jgi:hypothetical protein
MHHYRGSRFALSALAGLALGLGAYSNWSWLVAAGIAPVLLNAAPCALMCALGLCMGKKPKIAVDLKTAGASEPTTPKESRADGG